MYPSDVDLIWIATDGRGHLAAFITGGEGSIPTRIFESGLPALEETESLLMVLPTVSGVSLHVEVPNPEGYAVFAARGLFVFDWLDASRTLSEKKFRYEIAASPKTPIAASELTGMLSGIAALVNFQGINFEVVSAIDVSELVESVSPY